MSDENKTHSGDSKILVTGGSGMVGYALKWGYVHKNSIPGATFISSKDCDLRDFSAIDSIMKEYKPEVVIHLAAKVGGIQANMNYLGDFYRDNIMINTNVLEAARLHGVNKVVSLLSTCIYPNNVKYPLTEDQIHNGPPHDSNFGYAYAKRMLEVQTQTYRKQYGCNFITAISNNLYGENDNFDLENSHVIPAIIRKVHEASLENKEVVLWGDGTPLREFTYSGDMAEILLFLKDEYDGGDPINVGDTTEYSIREVTEMICDIMEYDRSKVIWDVTKPKGQHRKPSDNSKLLELGWKKENYSDFKINLKKVCEWYLRNYPNVRGVQ